MAKKPEKLSLSEFTESLKSSNLKMTPAMQAQLAEKLKDIPSEEPIAAPVVKPKKEDDSLKKSMVSLQSSIEKLIKAIQENTIALTKGKSKSTQALDLSENQIEDKKISDYQTRLLEKIEENTREDKTDKDEKEQKPKKTNLNQLALLGTLLAASLGAIAGVLVGQAKVMMGALKLLYKMIPTKLVEAVVNAVRRIPQILNDMVTKVMINIEYAFRIVIDLFKNRFPRTFKAIEDAVLGFKTFFVNVFDRARKIAVFLGEVISTIGDKIVKAFMILKNGFMSYFVQPITEGVKLISEGSASIGNGIRKAGSFIEGIKDFFVGIGNWLGNFAKVFKGALKIASAITVPITIIMGLFDGITEAIKGYEKDGIWGGILGFITGVINSVIGSFMDLIKDIISWVLNKLGFDEASKFLDSFSFSGMIKDFIAMFLHPVDTIRDMLVSLTKWLADIKIPEFSILGKKFGPWFPFKKMLTINGQDPTEAAAAENLGTSETVQPAKTIPPKPTANKVYAQSAEVKASEQVTKAPSKTNNVVTTQQVNNQTQNAIFKNPVRNTDNTYSNYLNSRFAI